MFEAESSLPIGQQELQRQRRHVDRPVEIAEIIFRLEIGERTNPRLERPGRVLENGSQPFAIGRDRLAIDFEHLSNAEPGVRASEVVNDDVIRFEPPLLLDWQRTVGYRRTDRSRSLYISLFRDQRSKSLVVISRVRR